MAYAIQFVFSGLLAGVLHNETQGSTFQIWSNAMFQAIGIFVVFFFILVAIRFGLERFKPAAPELKMWLHEEAAGNLQSQKIANEILSAPYVTEKQAFDALLKVRMLKRAELERKFSRSIEPGLYSSAY